MERIYHWMATAPVLHKLFLTLLVSGSMGAYYYLYPYKAATDSIEKSAKKVQYGEHAIREAKRNLENARKSKQEMDDMELKSSELVRRIPVSVDLSELVGELDQMADDVRISSIIPQDDDTESFDSVVVRPIKFVVHGRFHSICRFLYKMFQMNRLMDVGDVIMKLRSTTSDKNQDRNVLEAGFTARIYYSPSFIPSLKPETQTESPAKGGMQAPMGSDKPARP